jgi:hypothetical protein
MEPVRRLFEHPAPNIESWQPASVVDDQNWGQKILFGLQPDRRQELTTRPIVTNGLQQLLNAQVGILRTGHLLKVPNITAGRIDQKSLFALSSLLDPSD